MDRLDQEDRPGHGTPGETQAHDSQTGEAAAHGENDVPSWATGAVDHGLYPDMPFYIYQDQPGLNSTVVRAGAKSMRSMQWEMEQGTNVSPAMQFGSDFHRYFIEGQQVCAAPINPKTGKAFGKTSARYKDAARLADEEDQLMLTPEDAEKMALMADSLNSVEWIRKLRGKAEHCEASVFWKNQRGIERKGRIDWLRLGRNPFLADLKTVSEIDYSKLERKVVDNGWHIQLASYREAIKVLTGQLLDVFVVVVETSPPYNAAIYVMDTDTLKLGEHHADRIMRHWLEAQRTGHYWTQEPTKDIPFLTAKQWHLRDLGSEYGQER